ncbi:uncharacterized peroxidase-related enzyme [Chryseolinea serpens]|uniref:Uncharacterized peroxidase-related enzyme n=1 Tax=Chryseolinea serpens TaxID=947013 RepID=A0A1M5M5S9_9BACT|nr:peroxidase-related enzyme [Chryseolinea serpens]SHG72657.1 uncharacterized peroxidase-related enzyme [Chryseolinea serpens]
MPHITIPEGIPGIRGPLSLRPDVAKPLSEFTELLMRGENSLTRGERELIATVVSARNNCFFCEQAHGAVAQHYLQCDTKAMDDLKENFQSSNLSEKMKALLAIASQVQQSGKSVTPASVQEAYHAGATEREVHDTVLIAAAFCMFNRYVDGLDTWAPQDRDFYIGRAQQAAETGYTVAPLKK